MQKQVYSAQFASIKHQEITRILEEVLAGKFPSMLFTEEVIMKWFGLKDCFNPSSDRFGGFMRQMNALLLTVSVRHGPV